MLGGVKTMLYLYKPEINKCENDSAFTLQRVSASFAYLLKIMLCYPLLRPPPHSDGNRIYLPSRSNRDVDHRNTLIAISLHDRIRFFDCRRAPTTTGFTYRRAPIEMLITLMLPHSITGSASSTTAALQRRSNLLTAAFL